MRFVDPGLHHVVTGRALRSARELVEQLELDDGRDGGLGKIGRTERGLVEPHRGVFSTTGDEMHARRSVCRDGPWARRRSAVRNEIRPAEIASREGDDLLLVEAGDSPEPRLLPTRETERVVHRREAYADEGGIDLPERRELVRIEVRAVVERALGVGETALHDALLGDRQTAFRSWRL